MVKTIDNMKGVNVLGRDALKQIRGGRQDCVLRVQEANGTWHTYYGSCAFTPASDGFWDNLLHNGTDWCRTDYNWDGPVALTSNGGKSVCA